MRYILFALVLNVQCGVANAQRLVAFKQNDLVGFKDATGKVAVEPKYQSAAPFFNDFSIVRFNGKYGFVDTSGNEPIPLIYDMVYGFNKGYASAKLNGKWGLIDKENKTVIPFEYDDDFLFTDGLASVNKNGKYGFIDIKHRVVIPFVYDAAENFRDGLACVKKNDRYGFIDVNGKTRIDFNYDYAEGFYMGEAAVSRDSSKYYIDTHGNYRRNLFEVDDDDLIGVVTPVEASPPVPVDPAGEADIVFSYVQQMPAFPGGDAALYAYLAKNVQYPEAAVDQNIQGKVFVELVIAHDGAVTQPRILRGVHALLDKEALRVVRAMPRWSPGVQNGKPVSVRMTIPVKFVLE